MNILIYGDGEHDLTHMIKNIQTLQYRQLRFALPESYDAYLGALRSGSPDIIFITVPGAKGMEAAIAARDTCGSVRLVWLSDDEAFGAQSYRLGCDFFTAKPINDAVVADAMAHCGVSPPGGKAKVKI